MLQYVINQVRQLPEPAHVLRPGRTVGVLTVRCEQRGLGFIKVRPSVTVASLELHTANNHFPWKEMMRVGCAQGYSGAVHGERPALWSEQPTTSGQCSAPRELLHGTGPLPGMSSSCLFTNAADSRRTGWVPPVVSWGLDEPLGREKLAVEVQTLCCRAARVVKWSC